MRNPRRVLSKAQILDGVWNYDFGGQGNVVEPYISYLRTTIDVGRLAMIHTARGGLRAETGRLTRPMPTPADSGRRRLLAPSRWPLRARLVAGVVCLVALVYLAIGVVTQIALQHSLIGRLDAQLTAAGRRCS